MVWHIVKKDWRLLWPLVTALAVLDGLLAWTRFSAGHFFNGLPIVPGSLLQLLAAATVITLLVHQDPIPGVCQDWLVRPVSRRDMFLAKLLFAVLFVQGPWWTSDLLQGLANGFPSGQSAAAATECAVWVLVTLTLPVLAFAALTATTTETLVAMLGVFAAMLGSVIVRSLLGATSPTALTGFAWIPSLVRQVVMLAAAFAVLILQYRRRRTRTARALFAAALLIGLCAPQLPWRAALRLDQVLTASSPVDRGIVVAFAPDAGRFHLAPGQRIDDIVEKPGFGAADVAAENQRRRAEGARTVSMPVRVSGITPGWRLLADRIEVRLIDRGGHIVHQGTGNDFELRAASPETTHHQGIRVPGAVFARVQSDPLDLELEYSFTLFRAGPTYALPARDGDQRMPGVGWCETRVNDAGTHVRFQCLQPGERPSCLAIVLEHAPTHARNPEVSLCVPDYSTYPGHVLPDALSRFGGALPFYDPSGLAAYPVGGSQLADAQVVVTAFEPIEHLVRRVRIPAVRLQDWEPLAR